MRLGTILGFPIALLSLVGCGGALGKNGPDGSAGSGSGGQAGGAGDTDGPTGVGGAGGGSTDAGVAGSSGLRDASTDTLLNPYVACDRRTCRPICDIATCGNGIRDTCMKPVQTDECYTPNEPLEECDGADLVGQSCESLGFASGTLRCSATCTIDNSGCHVCLPLDANLLDCGEPLIEPPVIGEIGFVATSNEIGISWL